MNTPFDTCTAFRGHRRIAAGPLQAVALAVRALPGASASGPVLIFDDLTGRSVDIDTRGSRREVMARYALPSKIDATRSSDSADFNGSTNGEPRGRGRPKLGVVSREVTLLPRHWEWLASQSGGASVALRKLVEAARKTHAEADRRRKAQERAYHFMSAIAGDLPRFEEAARALFADDQKRFREQMARWPADVRNHALALAFGKDRLA